MIEALKGVDAWFMVFVIACLSPLALWLLSRSINKLDQTIDRFQELIDRLFTKYDDHESRLSKLEGKCETNHKD